MGCGASRSVALKRNILSENEAAIRSEKLRSDVSLSSASTPSVCSRPHAPCSSLSLPSIVFPQPQAHELAPAQNSSPSTTASQAESIPVITEQGPQKDMSEQKDIPDGCRHSVAQRRSVQPVGEDILRAFFE